MPDFERGDVVRIPFPYTDRNTRQHRPGLVVSAGGIGDQAGLIWVVMITSAANRRWPDDLDLEDRYGEAGLPAPSVVRPSKIATIEASAAESIGRLDEARLAVVMETIRRWLCPQRRCCVTCSESSGRRRLRA